MKREMETVVLEEMLLQQPQLLGPVRYGTSLFSRFWKANDELMGVN
jgi:hypothetical protein